MEESTERPVVVWLLLSAFLVACMVLVGGATRLTLSGLSMPEWHPLTGWLPPFTHKGWAHAFGLYRRLVPQYQLLNTDMTLQEFKAIYLWEYAHRVLGRITVLFFVVPGIYFLVRRQLSKKILHILLAVTLLLPLQGVLGWYMVHSGFAQNAQSVSAVRLVMHLLMAFIIYGLLITALIQGAYPLAEKQYLVKRRTSFTSPSWLRFSISFLDLAVFIQVGLGALVAGGQTQWVLFHRNWAIFLFMLTLHITYTLHRAGYSTRLWLPLLLSLCMQMSLGMGALAVGGIFVQFLHQMGGLAVFTCALYATNVVMLCHKDKMRSGSLRL